MIITVYVKEDTEEIREDVIDTLNILKVDLNDHLWGETKIQNKSEGVYRMTLTISPEYGLQERQVIAWKIKQIPVVLKSVVKRGKASYYSLITEQLPFPEWNVWKAAMHKQHLDYLKSIKK